MCPALVSILHCPFSVVKYVLCLELEDLMLFKSVSLIIGTNLFHLLAIGRVMITLYYFAVNKKMTTFYGYLAISF